MKRLMSAALILTLSAGSAFAAEGRVSQKSLNKMGLQGMKVMSDEKGMEIRGAGHGSPVFFLAFEILELIEKNVNSHHHHR
jgi:hypothetical protein